jgi:hypothetical protein
VLYYNHKGKEKEIKQMNYMMIDEKIFSLQDIQSVTTTKNGVNTYITITYRNGKEVCLATKSKDKVVEMIYDRLMENQEKCLTA